MQEAKPVVRAHGCDRRIPHHVNSKPSLDLEYTIAPTPSLRHYCGRAVAQLHSTHWRRGLPRASGISLRTATARSTQEIPRGSRRGSDAIFPSKTTLSIVRDLLGSGASENYEIIYACCAKKLCRTPLVKPFQSQAAIKIVSKGRMREVLTYLMPSLRLSALFAIFRRRFVETRSCAGFLVCFLLGENRNSQLQQAMLAKSEMLLSARP